MGKNRDLFTRAILQKVFHATLANGKKSSNNGHSLMLAAASINQE
jgi:hypothetical protein